jgi:hypothetical protein
MGHFEGVIRNLRNQAAANGRGRLAYFELEVGSATVPVVAFPEAEAASRCALVEGARVYVVGHLADQADGSVIDMEYASGA